MGEQRRKCLFLGALVCVAVAWLVTPLPDWVAGSVVRQIPLEDDVRIGRAAVAQTRLRPIRDRSVERAGEKLLAGLRTQYSALQGYEWHFSLVDDASVNAFALPGGSIFITSGLNRIVTDDELTAVIGHEIGHVLHRHSQQRLVRNQLLSTVMASVLRFNGDRQSEASDVTGLLLQQAESFSSLSYSRAQEHEADAVAWWACVSAGARPEALTSFLRKLDGGDQATRWESTHPGTRDRIAVLDRKYAELGDFRRRHDPAAAVAEHFAPPSLVDDGSGGSALDRLGAVLTRVPPSVQAVGLLRGLSLFASGADYLLTALFDGSAADVHDEGARSSAANPLIDCEDGESKISFEAVRVGYYIALGHGKCLTVDDLRGLRRMGRLNVNPYTRQPFTSGQLRDIDVLIRGGRL